MELIENLIGKKILNDYDHLIKEPEKVDPNKLYYDGGLTFVNELLNNPSVI